ELEQPEVGEEREDALGHRQQAERYHAGQQAADQHEARRDRRLARRHAARDEHGGVGREAPDGAAGEAGHGHGEARAPRLHEEGGGGRPGQRREDGLQRRGWHEQADHHRRPGRPLQPRRGAQQRGDDERRQQREEEVRRGLGGEALHAEHQGRGGDEEQELVAGDAREEVGAPDRERRREQEREREAADHDPRRLHGGVDGRAVEAEAVEDAQVVLGERLALLDDHLAGGERLHHGPYRLRRGLARRLREGVVRQRRRDEPALEDEAHLALPLRGRHGHGGLGDRVDLGRADAARVLVAVDHDRDGLARQARGADAGDDEVPQLGVDGVDRLDLLARRLTLALGGEQVDDLGLHRGYERLRARLAEPEGRALP